MPDLSVGEQHWPVAAGSNLLDALNAQGMNVPYSCRAGSCHACLVRCVAGEPVDANPEALAASQRQQGWRLACQCRVAGDLQVALFDPRRDGLDAELVNCDWLSPGVLRIRLKPERGLRYHAGQHLLLYSDAIARPYSIASLAQQEDFLEFHIDCRQPGAFADRARAFTVGGHVRLGELRGGALHYDPEWQARPLWLLAAGTGLAPLWGILREALRQEHQGPIRLVHVAVEGEHYLAEPLLALAEQFAQLQVELPTTAQADSLLNGMRLPSRQTQALVCGSPASVEKFSRRLFLAGLPRNQLLADVFIGRG
jgi:NAD(P)H-flavin reductase/ferredoxin